MSETQRHRILIVDDEEAILETMTFTFEDDYEVLTASDARRGLEALDRHAPVAAVLTDYRMPNMTGVEFLAQVYERHPETTRIILTGFGDIEIIEQAINDGHVYAYVRKPWEPDALKQIVRRAVELHDLQCEKAKLLTEVRSSHLLLQATMDQLGMGAIAIDPGGVVQAVNRPACTFFGLAGDPRGRRLEDALRDAGLDGVAAVLGHVDATGSERLEEVTAGEGERRRQLRLTLKTLTDANGTTLGRVMLVREISHEPLRRDFEDVLQEIVKSGEQTAREKMEAALPRLHRIADAVRASRIHSPGMSELAERASRTITALENWIAVDDTMAAESYPDAQLLLDRLRVARARWPLGDELPGRVRELMQRVEAYYESGDNPKRHSL